MPPAVDPERHHLAGATRTRQCQQRRVPPIDTAEFESHDPRTLAGRGAARGPGDGRRPERGEHYRRKALVLVVPRVHAAEFQAAGLGLVGSALLVGALVRDDEPDHDGDETHHHEDERDDHPVGWRGRGAARRGFGRVAHGEEGEERKL
eukprot:CAMPEP_0206002764 /NCGR_PEP_ID=MMETSP1464-20131121/2960_1 /ASSEMBLY_ACC=CAM_ASM_001124 /TAXON_ID=119497 /ORGANISM="Exanthemachrysis gayraliae, Strain RCC1523" /LENGTH=148 /DNA_ID=CAMNT_0053376117 /DNA_START=170 /DNA_END=612 /DNA_ORIENTATION=-